MAKKNKDAEPVTGSAGERGVVGEAGKIGKHEKPKKGAPAAEPKDGEE